ncbi:hypothetical protein C1645_839603 [Glomus cerebriforme]|uniref:Uncharacterized protein n=1 Tax=Glomus cerebriforme TaxID=658196 RepID=A0A397SB32_9GLOM|nr:hypothetical protein C1645_839603 [Glomus cerebriforme]
MIDAIIKDQHTSTSFITFLPHNLQHQSILPKWNDILIDTHLQKFLTQISNCKNFESFINLHRNSKYRTHISDINWEATFQYFDSDSESKLITNFSSSYRKSHKIKILIEELPTIEHMKKACPDLFNNWFCPLCSNNILNNNNSQKETFSHIFHCPYNSRKFFILINNNKKFLLQLLLQYDKSFSLSFSSLNSLSFLWSLSSNYTLNFIDLVKGIVPKVLFDFIFSFVKNNSITLDILFQFYNNIYKEFMEFVWIPRCEIQLVLERSHNIHRKQKFIRRNSSNPRSNSSSSYNSSNVPLLLDQNSLRNSIYFGGIFWIFGTGLTIS